MKTFFKEIVINTSKRLEAINITRYVEEAVRESGIQNGICLVFAPHATAAIIANEFEPGLIDDYIEFIKQVFKPDYRWKHNLIDNNAHAHLASAVIGPSRIFPVKDGRLVRGTWQEIILLELDGPRSSRRIIVEVLGE
ncbi:secondary thiamine-phosphate synthase enzyme YjbQ [Pyrofollis japonicus]|uniref:secondary thiamine-phosphate synthase enzyme YjbQ n=1 Tax=Pyrofollis japonicus TaxID=3060460 RepID=UPI00295B3825|nr:secondary thiamine-phosphate synthase enzyme YjbQ [Pyrofollis japonicus]BEP17698.1 secondary thiamine-phosphate synthase enzyme YjbQ [Pyrofollis japonicus]